MVATRILYRHEVGPTLDGPAYIRLVLATTGLWRPERQRRDRETDNRIGSDYDLVRAAVLADPPNRGIFVQIAETSRRRRIATNVSRFAIPHRRITSSILFTYPHP